MFFLIILGYIVTRILIVTVINPRVFTGFQQEDGWVFNKPNWLEWIEATFWLVLSLLEVFLMYERLAWNLESIFFASLSAVLGLLWFARTTDIISAQHSEIRLFPNRIEFRSHNEEWVCIEDIKSVYFTRIPSDRFSLANNPTDIVLIVQRTEHPSTTINIQGMRLTCYLAALRKHLDAMYTLLTKEPPSTNEEDQTTTTEHTPSADTTNENT